MPNRELELTFVRHGQGSFFTGDYDQLTELGIHQACLLGEYWVARRCGFDAIFCGPRGRQAKTAEIVGDRFRAAGWPWPEPKVIEEMDEFPFQDLLDILLPRLLDSQPHLSPWADRLQRAKSRETALEAFKPLFESLCQAWVSGQLEDPGVESWGGFVERVRKGIERILSAFDGNPGRSAIFTSGGPISVAIREALALSDERVLPLAWRIRNTAFCRLTRSSHWDLLSYNETPHLSRQEWITNI